MSSFDKKNILELRKMTMDEIIKYQLALRKFEYDNNVPLKHIEIRKKIHFLLLLLIKIDRILSKEKIEIIGDKRSISNKPIIYACTHIGGHDIERSFEAIKEHAYLFLGDPKEAYIDATGLLLKLNGMIPLETDNKEDRRIAYNRSVELLKKGGNLLIFPEGAWNLTPNLPVLKLFTGTVRMAKETGADIVPMAIEQVGNKFYINIGENIKYDSISNTEISEANKKLRDAMSTLKWEIWEKIGSVSRKSIPDNYEESFIKTIIDRCEYDFSLEEMLDDAFKDKSITIPEDAYIVSPKEEFEMRKKLSRGYY